MKDVEIWRRAVLEKDATTTGRTISRRYPVVGHHKVPQQQARPMVGRRMSIVDDPTSLSQDLFFRVSPATVIFSVCGTRRPGSVAVGESVVADSKSRVEGP